MNRLETWCATLMLAILPAAALAQPTYTLVDLGIGSPYDGGIALNSINSNGDISGYGVNNETGEIHAFI